VSKIRLHSGREFDFTDPDSTPLSIHDIAYALAREYRYSNQTHWLMTVAQHSVDAANHYLVPDEHRLGMLLHDASESVMRDISAPLKALLPDYRAIEERVQSSILQGLGIDPAPKELIRQVDEDCRQLEVSSLWDSQNTEVEKLIWNSSQAEFQFLILYDCYGGKMTF